MLKKGYSILYLFYTDYIIRRGAEFKLKFAKKRT